MTRHLPDPQALSGKRLSVTGRFASMSQGDMVELIRRCGGQVLDTPSRNTDWLVVGGEAWPLDEEGQLNSRLRRARRLRAAGYAIDILSEEQFLELLGLHRQPNGPAQRFTMGQLGRILGISRQRLRGWMARRLIEPVAVVHRLAYFDYQQLSRARMLKELTGAGVELRRIVGSLDRLRHWLEESSPLDRLAPGAASCLAVRLPDGRLVEPSGQLRLDFPEPSAAVLQVPCGKRTADDWFDAAVLLEEQGSMEEAAEAFREALRLDDADPVLHFNLANIVYSLGRVEDAARHYQQATLLDPAYLEAWNNRGAVLDELGRLHEAVEAFRRALTLWPGYADARYNLGRTLEKLGREEEAREQFAAYRALLPASPWSLALPAPEKS